MPCLAGVRAYSLNCMEGVTTMGATLASAIPVTTITSQITDMAAFFAIIVSAAFAYHMVRRAIRAIGSGRASA